MNRLARLPAFFWLVFCVLLVVVPMAVIVSALGSFDQEIWEFLWEFQLPVLIKHTLFLALAVGVGVFVLGVSTAWLVTMYRFPCQKWLSVALMLPLAMPAYVLAFCLVGLFEYQGWLATYFRQMGIDIPDIRNGAGVAVVMSLAFYPYVYLLARRAFVSMGGRAMEVGASLGLSPMQSFIKIALPMARPFVAGGVILALMEVLADFGTVAVFGFETFTTAIYEAWFGFFSLETAKQLAVLLVGFVLILVVLEALSRGRRQFFEVGRASCFEPKTLTGIQCYMAMGYCLLVVGLAFFVPLAQLLVWAVQSTEGVLWGELGWQAVRSLMVALVCGVVTAVSALFLVLSVRTCTHRLAKLASKIATLGYAIPGTVLAVGIFVPIATLDNWLIAALHLDTDALLKGTLFVMVLGFLVRFLALSVQAVEGGMARLRQSHTDSAYALGKTPKQTLWQVYVPMLKGSLGVAVLMVFVDVMKEIPITLMLRPTGFDMLSARVFAFTTEGLYDKAAFPALVIVAVGLVPVIWFLRMGEK